MPDRVEITLNLPQELVERAQSAGLLTEAQVERWLTEELARERSLSPRELMQLPPEERHRHVQASIEAAADEDFETFEAYSEEGFDE